MTDEEIKNKAKETSGGNYYYEQGFIYGFELGEENGKKEKETDIFDKWCRGEGDECQFLENLEKENAELKAQIEQLSNDNHVLKTAFIEQQEQIEKMKCCENCKHNGSDNEIGENGDYTDYTCIQCEDFSTKENPYPNWELAEC